MYACDTHLNLITLALPQASEMLLFYFLDHITDFSATASSTQRCERARGHCQIPRQPLCGGLDGHTKLELPFSAGAVLSGAPPAGGAPLPSGPSSRTLFIQISTVMINGFNPVWEKSLSLPFVDCAGRSNFRPVCSQVGRQT
jgi:hypothetical protein